MATIGQSPRMIAPSTLTVIPNRFLESNRTTRTAIELAGQNTQTQTKKHMGGNPIGVLRIIRTACVTKHMRQQQRYGCEFHIISVAWSVARVNWFRSVAYQSHKYIKSISERVNDTAGGNVRKCTYRSRQTARCNRQRTTRNWKRWANTSLVTYWLGKCDNIKIG